MSKKTTRPPIVPFHEGGTFIPKPGKFTGGRWRRVLNQIISGKSSYSVFSSEKGLDGLKKCISISPTKGHLRGKFMTKKEARANAKLIAQGKNNLLLLQELESFYLNKGHVSVLTIPEVGILSKISEQIKKSI